MQQKLPLAIKKYPGLRRGKNDFFLITMRKAGNRA